MRVDLSRACDAAKEGYAALAQHLDRNRPEGEPASVNERLVAVAVLFVAAAQAGGLSPEDLFGLALKVAEPAVTVQ